MRYINKLWLPFVFFISLQSDAQPRPNNLCPPNIGFESGSFNSWECFAGMIARDGSLNLSLTAPVGDRHTIFANTFPQDVDPYGGFPVNCPNGSGYSVRLGNSSAGGQAESTSYTFSIPSDKNDYSFLYNYAVVFQNPPHLSHEQPRFTSRIFNVTDNQYIQCGSFEFIASGGIPGFYLSNTGNNVFYKPWSPVTVNLSGLAGKTVRLEFFTNDCAFTQHFGYAYIDVNEDCSSSPVSGSTYCGTPQSVTLTAPFGFAGYNWYTSDFSQLLGRDNTLTITPAPPANTTYALAIVPFDGLGCEDTLFTTVNVSSEPMNLTVIDEIKGCMSGVDITSPAVTTGSTPGLNYSYFTDLSQTNYVPIPSRVTASGTYYIKGVNRVGCNDIKPIRVIIIDPPNLLITSPAGVCMPQKIDITDPDITAGSEAGLTLTYWQDINTTIPVPNPSAVTVSGTYYIRAITNNGCPAVKRVDVKIGAIPNIIIRNPTACGKVDLSDEDITTGSTPDLSYSYWLDAAATIPVPDPTNITLTGTYFIMASSPSGCSLTYPVMITVNPIPDFIVTDPKPVNYPVQTIDITLGVNQNTGLTYTYWLDSLTRRPLASPKAVDKRGRYFIRGTNEFGCSTIKPVNANIIPPPEPIVYVPTGFTPNNDGLNDIFKIKIIGEAAVHHLKIYNRWGHLIYDDPDMKRNWNGKLKGIDLPNGVYVWILGVTDTYHKKYFAHKGLITLIR